MKDQGKQGRLKEGFRKMAFAFTLALASNSFGRCLLHASAYASDHKFEFHAEGIYREIKLGGN